MNKIKLVVEISKRGMIFYNETTKDRIDLFPKTDDGENKLLDVIKEEIIRAMDITEKK